MSHGLMRIPLSTQVADLLLEEILNGSYEVGSSLPSEGDLVEQFGVSRVVIREAIRVLETRGVVSSSQGKRPVVSGLTSRMPTQFFDMVLRTDERAVFELVEVRQTLEVANASLAASRATDDDLQGLQAAIDDMRANREQPAAYDAADVAFHERLAAASGNRFHRLLIEALGDMLRASREASRRGHILRGLEAAQSITAHEQILAALTRRDPDAAANEMRAHLDTALDDLEAAFQQGSLPEVPSRDKPPRRGS